MKFYYFNSTHWDREWYQPFEVYRKYLADTAELLLDIFRRLPDYRQFTFDGQTVVLEDICELRPSLRGELEAAIRSGRLKVGPWYVMPDEFLCSTEALVRNLLAGRRTAKDFGAAAWPVGYVCDIFGHIAQMPQILKGFGLMGAVVWRGFPPDTGAQVMWRGPDGTQLPTLRLTPHHGYANFTLEVRGWWNMPMDKADFQKRFKEWVERYPGHFGESYVLSDALDHCQPTEFTREMFGWIRELYPDAEIIHSDLTEFFRDEFKGKTALVEGERLVPCSPDEEAPGGHNGVQISATLSSRYDVKQANDQCQNLLELALEPTLAYRAMAGEGGFNEDYRYIWKHLLKNHPHDSICGCSIDQVHRQVMGRFADVRSLAGCLLDDFKLADRERLTGVNRHASIHAIEGDSDDIAALHAASDGVYRLRLFNPLPQTDERVQEIEIPFPGWTTYPARQAEVGGASDTINRFRLYDAAGNEVPYALKSVLRKQTRRIFRHHVKLYDCYTVVCRPRLQPGWNSLFVRPDDHFVRNWGSQLTGRMTAENGLLRLEVLEDGTYTVTDLRSGRAYPGQNRFRFDREMGDGWFHVAPSCAPVLLGGRAVAVRLLLDSALRTEFEIVRRYELPAEVIRAAGLAAEFVNVREGGSIVSLDIRTVVGLEAGSDELQVAVSMENNVRDYRLRLAVPTGIGGGYWAAQNGAFIRRNDGRQEGGRTQNWPEAERVGINFDGILARRDDRGGVALVAPEGIHEGGGMAADGELFVTLMRTFSKTVNMDGEPDGELLGHREWRLALKFLQPETGRNALGTALRRAKVRPLSHMLPEERVANPPADTPFLTLEGGAVFGVWKPCDDGAANASILRLYNYDVQRVQTTVRLARPLKAAWKCRLDETEPVALKLLPDGYGFQAEVAPAELATFRLEE